MPAGRTPSSDAPFQIRPAQETDLDALGGLYADYMDSLERSGLYYQVNRDALPDVLATRVKSRKYLAAVAVLEDEVCGFVFASIGRPPAEYTCEGESAVGYLNDVYTDPSARRLGVAGALVDYAESWLAEAGVAGMELVVLSENQAGKAFWEARGAKSVGTLRYKKLGS